MPTLQELSDLFGVLPELPPPLPRQKRPANNAQEQSKPNEPAKAASPAPTTEQSQPNEPEKAASPALSPTTTEQSFLRRLFPWAFLTLQATKERKVNPFMALKAGKKMIIIAAVDSGNISFFRFSEGAFCEWPMA
ncbi:hypothetical protein H1R20_g2641, partial [Candolleomyces eurysporus]